ncbi:hypothetical protein [Rhodospirillum sp. A1_3_36]|uniref:hypothetical protein n=1 Tax=Rhodospirillum sp. A1_3_36 TaxID=3391666 RepID=UPI0039A48877
MNSQITEGVTQTTTKGPGEAPLQQRPDASQTKGVVVESVLSLYGMASVPTRLSGLTDLLNRGKGIK